MALHTDFSKIRAVLFDVDGTLYRGGIALHLVLGDLRHCLLSLAERKSRKAMKSHDYGDGETFYEAFFSMIASRTNRTITDLRSWYFDRYMPLMASVVGKHCKPQVGVSELFAALKAKGIKVVIYSDYTKAREKMEALGIDCKDVDAIYCAEELGALKPQTRPFHAICHEIGVEESCALMVGDTPSSDGGAVDAGMPFVCLEGKKTKNVDRNTAPYDIMSWTELADNLKR